MCPSVDVQPGCREDLRPTATPCLGNGRQAAVPVCAGIEQRPDHTLVRDASPGRVRLEELDALAADGEGDLDPVLAQYERVRWRQEVIDDFEPATGSSVSLRTRFIQLPDHPPVPGPDDANQPVLPNEAHSHDALPHGSDAAVLLLGDAVHDIPGNDPVGIEAYQLRIDKRHAVLAPVGRSRDAGTAGRRTG